MNNVYIGARYVPKFDGDWDAIKSYEPLTIVSYGNNTYTSKRAVPVGIIPTNTDYWALTGNYNGALSTLTERVDDLESEVNVLAGRKIIFIGDSYFTGNGGITSVLPSRITDIIKADSSYNFAHGSTGFVRNTDNKKFANQIQDAINDTAISKNLITDILIAGGINDEYSTTEGQYETELSAIKTKCAAFPNAQIWVVPMLWGINPMNYQDSEKLNHILNALYKIGGFNVLPDAWQILLNRSNDYMQDSIHPNSLGYNLMGSIIGGWMNGSSLYQRFDAAQITNENNDICAYSIIRLNGANYLKGKITLRNAIYQANSVLFSLANAANGTINPLAIAETAGVVGANHLYIDEAGNLKCDTDIGNIDIVFAGAYPMIATYPIN